MENGWTNSEIIQFALGLWTNYIETGNISLSAQDAQDQGSKFNALSIEQMKLIVRIKTLQEDIRKKKIKVD